MSIQTATRTEAEAKSLFDERYITAQQIAEYVDVTRVSVFNARKNGRLPGGFPVGATYVWEREFIKPHIDYWRESVQASRSIAA